MSEELTPKACPHCGAARSWTHSIEPGEILFNCGTYSPNFDDQPMIRADKQCYERELNAVRGELEQWKQALCAGDAARDRVRWDGDTNMIACRKERDQLRTTNAELLEALRGLLYEYDDRDFQFGGDCLWQKHEDADTIDKARAAITKATEKPAQTES